MLTRTLKCVAVLACGTLALAGLSAPAGDKQGGKDRTGPSGVWVIQGGELKIDFTDKEVLKISPHGENPVIVIHCKYTAGKDGVVKAQISEYEGKDRAKEKIMTLLPLGLEFSFRWQAKAGEATLDGVKGKDIPDLLKSHLEGKYEPKK